MLPEPLHRQIEKILKERIGTVYPHGAKIPPEVDLAKEFQVSLSVIRHALGDLVQQGFIVRRRGSGSYVRAEAPSAPVALFFPSGLSEKANPFPELTLLEHCITLLEEQNAPYLLLPSKAAASGRSEDGVAQPVHYRAALCFSPLASPLPVHAERWVGPIAQTQQSTNAPLFSPVQGDYAAFLERASQVLKEKEYRKIGLVGSPSIWSGLAPDRTSALPHFWSLEDQHTLAALPVREANALPDALILSDPEQAEAVLPLLAQLARTLPAPPRLLIAGFHGDPRRAFTLSAIDLPSAPIFIDLDLHTLARAMVQIALEPQAPASPRLQRLDAWIPEPR